jgi:hypothetical protein
MNARSALLSLALSSVFMSGIVAPQAFAETSVGPNLFSSFDSHWSKHLERQAGALVSRGATPIITWMPYKQARPDANILKEIIDGQQDAYLKSWLSDFKGWLNTYPKDQQPTIALRFSHEFMGTSYAWGSKPDAMKAAWHYLHNKFEEAGINEAVEWVWSVEEGGFNKFGLYYPGDDVVDLISIDGHQRYLKTVDNFPKKPIMLVESSATESHELSDIRKDKYVVNHDYPSIKMIARFNADKELGWAINLRSNDNLAQNNDALSKEFVTEALNEVADVSDWTSPKGNQSSLTLSDYSNNAIPAKKPKVVGSEILAIEAEGLRNMDKDMLRKWRLESILPK